MGLPVPVVPREVVEHAQATGALESPLIWGTFVSLAVAAAMLAFRFRGRTGARRSALAVMLCCVVLGAVTATNSYVGYIRTPRDLALLLQRGGGPLRALGEVIDDGSADTRPRPAGFATPDGVHAPILERLAVADPANAVPEGRTFVLLPPGYHDRANDNRRYPVTYLVHGFPAAPEDWLGAGDAPGTLRMAYLHRAIAPMIVVSVDLTAGQPGRDLDGLDIPGGPRLETYLAQTVVATIDRHYRTIPDRTHRALGGMSGGAFAALNIGLHHTDKFAALLLTMPYDTTTNGGLLGADPALVAANTPRTYLPTMPFPNPVATILTAGTGAPADITTANRIADALHARGQGAVVHLQRGYNHTWHTARAALPYLLAFADQVFKNGPR
ncbi:alpha/beta hydrolase [Amycolatopsis keratiniphila]|uniref:alpha/beta hydrolase n=1 Tax=Amycolatopsis keratiniphila TaxID=129921 RepID=UPI00087B58A5|nr:alpha/beta hydrolase-fold protein [Amycolatopsis keratiniphila]SDU25999.1 S-formylglutathione hydrolase FrmB [Amycolatopsis keratiniphila]